MREAFARKNTLRDFVQPSPLVARSQIHGQLRRGVCRRMAGHVPSSAKVEQHPFHIPVRTSPTMSEDAVGVCETGLVGEVGESGEWGVGRLIVRGVFFCLQRTYKAGPLGISGSVRRTPRSSVVQLLGRATCAFDYETARIKKNLLKPLEFDHHASMHHV